VKRDFVTAVTFDKARQKHRLAQAAEDFSHPTRFKHTQFPLWRITRRRDHSLAVVRVECQTRDCCAGETCVFANRIASANAAAASLRSLSVSQG
jgi:hypothetical protein